MYKTKLIQVAEDIKRELKRNDTRSLLEKLIQGDISKEDYMEEVANQQQKYGKS